LGACVRGNPESMIGVGIALLVVGIIVLFMLPWVGIVLGVVGLVLTVMYFAGFGRRAARGEQPADRRV
jgi:4-hydroxybenzoate polyprenyltransferase